MVEPVNNNYNTDFFSKAKPVVNPADVQMERQAVVEKPDEQSSKKQADTVTISPEALTAQQQMTNTKSTAEEAREKAIKENQDAAANGFTSGNPKENMVQAYGVSQ